MKTTPRKLNGLRTALAVSAITLLAIGSAQAQTTLSLTNPGFESATAKVKTGFSTIDGWTGNGAGTADTDTGVEETGGDTLSGPGIDLGNYHAYANGGESGAYQIASGGTYTMSLGDVVTLTWEAAPTSNGAVSQSFNGVQLFSTTATSAGAEGSEPANFATLALNTAALGGTRNQFQTYTLTYTVQAADVGKSVGVQFDNTGAAGTYVGFDNFQITVVPEPSTVVLAMIFGIGMLFFFRRRRIA